MCIFLGFFNLLGKILLLKCGNLLISFLTMKYSKFQEIIGKGLTNIKEFLFKPVHSSLKLDI